MAVVFRLGQVGPERLAFGFSPAQEALHSLHVLFHPKHHPLHVHWVVRTRQRMSPALKAEADAYRFLVQQWLPVYWDVRQSAEIRTFHEELAEFLDRDVTFFAKSLVSIAVEGPAPAEGTSPSTLANRALADLANRFPEGVPVVAEVLADPERARQRFARFLAAYWEHALAADWPRVEELFLQDIARRARLLVRRGVLAALEHLAPNARIDHSGSACIISHRLQGEAALSGEDHLYLMPSYFAWPQLMLRYDQAPYLITYPVFEHQREGRAPVPPERLLKMLRAVGDMTRMQILQLIAQQPRSNTELAGLIGISEAAVSKHLKQLQEAGLLAAERRSYYLFYHLVRPALTELTENLESTLTGEG
ncbi:MAG: DUF5937 family protein [Bacillota bacterium]